jgi:hypothetical protein
MCKAVCRGAPENYPQVLSIKGRQKNAKNHRENPAVTKRLICAIFDDVKKHFPFIR